MSDPASPDPLDGFHVVVPVPVAWGDMDAFGHVNNTVYLRWFETARIAYFERVGFGGGPIGPILARTSCRFRLPLAYPDTVLTAARVSELQDDRFLMVYRVVRQDGRALAADGDGLIVAYDYEAKTKSQLPATVRDAVSALDGV